MTAFFHRIIGRWYFSDDGLAWHVTSAKHAQRIIKGTK